MQINYIFDKYGRLSNVTFEGLSGLEAVSNLKEAVNMLILTNPAKTFAGKKTRQKPKPLPQSQVL